MEYELDKLQNETIQDWIERIAIDKLEKKHNTSWKVLEDILPINYGWETLRKYAQAWKESKDNRDVKDIDQGEKIKYKEASEMMKDGSFRSDKLLNLTDEDLQSPEKMLKAHGYNPDKWELISYRNSVWNVQKKGGEVGTLYSSKIAVKPITKEFTMKDLIDILSEKVEKVKPISLFKDQEDKLLEISLFDLHFGINDSKYYSNAFNDICKVVSNGYKTILIVIGQDLLHHNDFKGHTANGTMIGELDIRSAIKDAISFYSNIIDFALENNHVENIHVTFSNGNHDETTSWILFQALIQRYIEESRIQFDDEFKERKHFLWNGIFIGFTHADKSGARTPKAFEKEYKNLMLEANIVELHNGHFHFEQVKDENGYVSRTLPTGAKTDDWHYDKGFVGAYKRFQLFEYSPHRLENIYYVYADQKL